MSSPPSNSSRRSSRRTSVTPASCSFIRHNNELPGVSEKFSLRSAEKAGRRQSSNAESSTFNPSDKLRRMSTLFAFDRTSAKEALLAAFEDPCRIEYRKLRLINEQLTSDWKQLKRFIEQLQESYSASRQLDPIRRYKQLQSMTKRTVMYVRLTEVGSVASDPHTPDSLIQGSVLQSEAKAKEIEKRISRMSHSLSTEEVESENRRLREMNSRLETRIELIVQTINELDALYRSSKHDSFVKRYNALREMIKDIVNNTDLIEAP